MDSARAFQGTLEEIGGVLLVRLPAEVSSTFPTRGMAMAEGTLGDLPFVLPLEPDGEGGHFLMLPPELAAQAGLKTGEMASLRLKPTANWPEPELPDDFRQSLEAMGLMGRYLACTVKGRWEWLRWMRATNSPQTRQKRIAVACDKLSKGDKRPCCFNSAACTVMAVCRTGILQSAN